MVSLFAIAQDRVVETPKGTIAQGTSRGLSDLNWWHRAVDHDNNHYFIKSGSQIPSSFPINYRYDYLQDVKDTIGLLALQLEELPSLNWIGPSSFPAIQNGQNCVELPVKCSGFPYRTALHNPKHNKHWESSVTLGRELIRMFAQDAGFSQTLKSGATLAQVASSLLEKAGDDFLRHPIYMFPHADKERAALLEITIVYIFVFDDFQEMGDTAEVPMLQQDFLSRLLGTYDATLHCENVNTPLQNFIDESIAGLRRGADTGGQDVLQTMIDFIINPRPPKFFFSNLLEFLEWRREDAAVRYILAGVKYSIHSRVDINSPKLARLVALFSDHMIYVNDMASYEKEKHSFDRGEAKMLANVVEILQQMLSLPNSQRAKAVAYTLQLQVEVDIYSEMDRLKYELTSEEWRWIHACIDESAGHCLVSHILWRYGGEKCRLASPLVF